MRLTYNYTCPKAGPNPIGADHVPSAQRCPCPVRDRLASPCHPVNRPIAVLGRAGSKHRVDRLAHDCGKPWRGRAFVLGGDGLYPNLDHRSAALWQAGRSFWAPEHDLCVSRHLYLGIDPVWGRQFDDLPDHLTRYSGLGRRRVVCSGAVGGGRCGAPARSGQNSRRLCGGLFHLVDLGAFGGRLVDRTGQLALDFPHQRALGPAGPFGLCRQLQATRHTR